MYYSISCVSTLRFEFSVGFLLAKPWQPNAACTGVVLTAKCSYANTVYSKSNACSFNSVSSV